MRGGGLEPELSRKNVVGLFCGARKLADTYELADKEQNFMGVRKGRMEWQRVAKKSTDPKMPHETEKDQTGVYKEATEYDIWYNKQLLRAVEILQCTTEFAGKHKPGQDGTFAVVVNELIALLTEHEEDLLKHLMDLNWRASLLWFGDVVFAAVQLNFICVMPDGDVRVEFFVGRESSADTQDAKLGWVICASAHARELVSPDEGTAIVEIGEFLCIIMIATFCAARWTDKVVVYVSDNQLVMRWITNLRARCKIGNYFCGLLTLLQARFRFEMYCVYINTKNNMWDEPPRVFDSDDIREGPGLDELDAYMNKVFPGLVPVDVDEALMNYLRPGGVKNGYELFGFPDPVARSLAGGPWPTGARWRVQARPRLGLAGR